MFSAIKSQIIKPFLQFAKNLSIDQINVSLLKGEGHLKTLELNEVTLMELLDLPTWLYLRKAVCTTISFKLSRLTLVSKTPTWQNGALNLTRLSLPSANAILLFKELTWDSARIVADGLLHELNGIPVKLITNTVRIRLTFKKCLSDSALISSRIQLCLDDLLWVLTLSQVEASIVFLRSLKHSVHLAAEQSKLYAASRAQRQTISWKTTADTSAVPSVRQTNAKLKEQYSTAARVFNHYDVLETSYHVSVYRTEIHFCDETKTGTQVISAPNGYIKVHVFGVQLDWYPYNISPSNNAKWHGHLDFIEARDTWLAGLHPTLSLKGPPSSWSSMSSSSFEVNGTNNGSLFGSNSNAPFIQSVCIMRVNDVSVSHVSFPSNTTQTASPVALPHFGDELPANTNLFIGSDKKLHSLSAKTNLLTVELRSSFHSVSPSRQARHPGPTRQETQPPPIVMFSQLKPFYVRFDPDTVIWLNVFLLTLNMHLAALMSHRTLRASQASENLTDKHARYLLRCEALMPRLILPLNTSKSHDTLSGSMTDRCPGPDALVLQVDEVVIQLLTPPLSVHTAAVLNRTLQDQPSSDAFDEGGAPMPIDVQQFTDLVQTSHMTDEVHWDNSTHFWCLHCPNVWAQFLTVVEVFQSPVARCSALARPRQTVYRQPLLDPVPLTLWASVSTQTTNRPPIDVIVDLDCAVHPLNPPSKLDKPANICVATEPISLILGATPAKSRQFLLIPSRGPRLPDALDQVLLLRGLSNQLLTVKDQLGVDMLRLGAIRPTVSSDNSSPQWLGALSFRLRRSLELRLVTPTEPEDNENMSPIGRNFSPTPNPVPTSQTHAWSSSDVRLNNNTGKSKNEDDVFQLSNPPVGNASSYRTEQNTLFVAHNGVTCVTERLTGDLTNLPQSMNVTHSNDRLGLLQNPLRSVSSSSNMSNQSFLRDDASISDHCPTPGSQDEEDDWLNNYQALIDLDDDNRSIGSDVSSMRGARPGGRMLVSESTPALLIPDEIGLDVLREAISPCSSKSRNSSRVMNTTLSRPNSQPRNQREVDSAVLIKLTNMIGVADATDSTVRLWLKLSALDVIKSHSVAESSRQANSDLDSSPKDVFVWSVSLVTISHNKSVSDGLDPVSWDTSVQLHANLLTEWTLSIPPMVSNQLTGLATELLRRISSGWASGMRESGTLHCVELPPPRLDFRVNLQGGAFWLDFSDNLQRPNGVAQLIQQICLQQGLSVNLDATTLQISHEQAPSGRHALMSGHSTLLRQYSMDNKRLKDEVLQLTSNVAHLQSELARVQLLLDCSNQR